MKSVSVELKSLNNALLRRLRRQTDADCGDITGTNGWIIAFLAENSEREVYQHELETEFSITRSTASRVINLMERKGLIARSADALDGRRRILRLTERAREAVERLGRDNERIGGALTRGFSDKEIDNLFDYIERMKQNIESEDM